ncbi:MULTISPECIES: DNA adenine methylase [Parabacteroides]|uniref:Uncharacterized protein n=1 Tax=Parabacteroides merdae TaxID=46503 RepID=A0AA37K8D5_9BACT|nr:MULTISPECIES: DNA adenine methylase [Parabacteroides]MCQ5223355.1 DNA adenine methylase [Parabacteroides merdae]GKH73196.1 hypothetical protein CE91St3_30590 [Parabacteroides merdae]
MRLSIWILHPITASSSFTSYTPKGWNEEDQLRLRDACRSLDKRGIRFLMSNSSAQFIKEIYQDFTVHVVKATRSINSKGSGRSGIDELLICNYTV